MADNDDIMKTECPFSHRPADECEFTEPGTEAEASAEHITWHASIMAQAGEVTFEGDHIGLTEKGEAAYERQSDGSDWQVFTVIAHVADGHKEAFEEVEGKIRDALGGSIAVRAVRRENMFGPRRIVFGNKAEMDVTVGETGFLIEIEGAAMAAITQIEPAALTGKVRIVGEVFTD